jgi:hypothetical protein
VDDQLSVSCSEFGPGSARSGGGQVHGLLLHRLASLPELNLSSISPCKGQFAS